MITNDNRFVDREPPEQELKRLREENKRLKEQLKEILSDLNQHVNNLTNKEGWSKDGKK